MLFFYHFLHFWDPRTFPKPSNEAILKAIESTSGHHEEICEYMKSHFSAAFSDHIAGRLLVMRDENQIRFLEDVPCNRFQPGTFGRTNRWVTRKQMRRMKP